MVKRVERLNFGFASRAKYEAEDAAAEERAKQREKARAAIPAPKDPLSPQSPVSPCLPPPRVRAARLKPSAPVPHAHPRRCPLLQDGLPREYFWRLMWLPEKGAFLLPPADFLDVAAHERAEAAREEREATRVVGEGDARGFAKGGETYLPGDHLFIEPEGVDALEPVEKVVEKKEPSYLKGGKHKGASQNLKAFAVAELLSVSKAVAKDVGRTVLKVRRFVRPEDVGPDCAYRAGWRDVFYSTIEADVFVDAVVGKCQVVPQGTPEEAAGADAFVCVGTFDEAKRAVQMGVVPAELKAPAAKGSKGKGKASAAKPAAAAADSHAEEAADPVRLATMDIFAGCGGLSEGMRQAGAARAKWAIEYEPDAAEAFRINHPGAHVFNANCNVILHRALDKSGLGDDCVASDDCKAQSAAMAPDQAAAIPAPGEVEFICGGPPCQGFSGMNRFTLKGSLWSKVQNEMILAYLSYADLYRPRYFLLENVRNFVSFNKGATFRTAVRTLIEIGYQVRFGVLNAGFYGCAQSRKRAFLFATAPGEVVPDWCVRGPSCTTLPALAPACAPNTHRRGQMRK